MSSILIKGMEMPTSCSKCHLSQPDGVGYICPITQGKPIVDCRQKTRHPNCPLVPVSPHGRLIDADALVNKHFGKEFLSKVMTADKDDMGTALINIPLVINNAPTIIEAEEAPR